MSKLTDMPGLGKIMSQKLHSVDINSAEELILAGSKDAYLKIKSKYPNVCINHLYALESAIQGMPWGNIPDEIKKELKEFHDTL